MIPEEDWQLIGELWAERDKLLIELDRLNGSARAIRRDLKQLTNVAIAEKFGVSVSTLQAGRGAGELERRCYVCGTDISHKYISAKTCSSNCRWKLYQLNKEL